MVFQSKDITAAACAAFINRAGRICFFLLQLYFFVRLFVEIVYLFVFSLHLLICKAGDFGLFDLSSIISLKFFLRLFINFFLFLVKSDFIHKKGSKVFLNTSCIFIIEYWFDVRGADVARQDDFPKNCLSPANQPTTSHPPPDCIKRKTSPKAQRTRELSSQVGLSRWLHI